MPLYKKIKFYTYQTSILYKKKKRKSGIKNFCFKTKTHKTNFNLQKNLQVA